MKGWRTIAFNIAIAAGTVALNEILSFDWVNAVGPQYAMLIVGAANIALRVITTGPIGSRY